MAGGGGGMAGIVDYPLYMTTIHGLWLTECNLILQAALSGASPYSGAFAYNPEPDLDAFLAAWQEYEDAVADYSTAQWDDLVAIASAEVDSEIDPTSLITAHVAAFEASQAVRLQRSVGRFSAGMADASAALTSAFVFGAVEMEQEHNRSSDELEARLYAERGARRLQAVLTGTGQLIAMLDNQLDHRKGLAGMRGELAKMTIGAQSARLDQELAIDEKDALWDLSLFTYPGNLLASISGGVATHESTPRSQQMMSNSLGLISALGPLVAAL